MSSFLCPLHNPVLKFLADLIGDCSAAVLDNPPTSSVELLSAAMKVFMNLLHHSLSRLTGSCDQHSHDSRSQDLPAPGQSSSFKYSCTEEVEETRELLLCTKRNIEELLIKGGSLSRDVLTTSSMLYVVMVSVCYSSCLRVKLQQLCERWFHPDSLFPTISQLSVAHSLLAKLSPHDQLTVCIGTTQPLLLWLFPVTCDIFDKLTETPDRYAASRTLCMWSNAAKECVMCDNVSVMVCESLAPSKPIVQKLLHYIWLLWEDPLESVRHQCRALFSNLVLIAKSLGASSSSATACESMGGDFLYSLCRTLLSLPSSTRGKYVLLTLLVPHMCVGVVLEVCPQLPDGILSAMGHQLLACKAGELWSKMVTQNFAEEEDKRKWQKTWLHPLVSVLMKSNALARLHVKQYCLPSVLSSSPHALDMCIESIHVLSPDTMPSLTAQLACLRTAISYHHQISLVDTYIDTISTAISHKDEQVVSSAFALLCESKGTTEPPREQHLKLVLECVRLHMNTQSAGFRYELLTALKKIFNRICDGDHKLEKQRRKGRAVCEIDDILTAHKEFLRTITERCFEVLHPLCTYQRRHFALSVLQLMNTIFSSTLSERVAGTPFSLLVTKSHGHALLHTLWDTFDSNRSIAVELLLTLPQDKTGVQDEEFIVEAATSCCSMMVSPKNVSCVTAYCLTKLLVTLAPHQLTLQLTKLSDISSSLGENIQSTASLSSQGSESSSHLSAQLSVGWCLVGILHRHLAKARADLVEASITAPMYGVLQSLRSVLETIEISTVQSSCVGLVKELLSAIIGVCADVGAIASPVVCNSSPEGFLPSYEAQSGSEKDVLLTDEDAGCIHGNAQSLLLCCWHCCKEVVSLLRVIVGGAQNRAVTLREETLLTSDQLEVISSLLLHLLTEARHRGAFEIAYTGFTALCQYLWCSPAPTLHCRPREWMNELLMSLSHSSSLTQLLSITRRSAGLPFYVQAILTTEPLSHSRECLTQTVTALLSVAASHSSTVAPCSSSSSSSSLIAPVPAAVHALNILRALYRESKLGEVMVSFIAEGVIVAAKGFSSTSWTVRNSSTLLLSALVTRIFGVKKVHEEHSMENKMSANEFFSRFPSLHHFLLSELISASQEGKTPERLFPVLLLLSRLKPSPQLRSSSSHLLPPFLPPLISLAGCSVWKCRILIAQSLVATLSLDNTVLLLSLIDELHLSDQNRLHGLLLMIANVLIESSLMIKEREGKFKLVAADKILGCLLKKTCLGKRCNHCTITRALYLHCVSLVLSGIHSSLSADVADLLLSLALDCQTGLLQENKLGRGEGSGEREQNGVEVEDCTFGPVASSLAERQFLFLRAAEPFLFAESSSCSSISILSLHKLVLKMVTHSKSIPQSAFEFLVSALQERTLDQSDCIEKVINGAARLATMGEEHGYLLLCTVLQYSGKMESAENTLAQVFAAAVTAVHTGYLREELLVAMLRFIQHSLKMLAHHERIAYKVLATLLCHLKEWCNETSPDCVRVEIAGLLGRNWSVFITLEHVAEEKDMCGDDKGCSLSRLFWQVCITLLQDVEEDVREEMCSSLTEMLSSTHCHSSGRESNNPILCQQATLGSFISSIPHVYKATPALGISLLLSLFPDSPQGSLQDPVSRLLFDEDKTNAFAEESELLQCIWNEIENLCSIFPNRNTLRELLSSELFTDSTCEQNEISTNSRLYRVGNPWVNTAQFGAVVRKMLLDRVLEYGGNKQCLGDNNDCVHPLLLKLVNRRQT